MESKHFSVVGAAFLCLLLIPVIYAASYLAMVERETVSAMTANGCFTRHSLAYRAGGDAAFVFFAPAHDVDRWLRPDYWTP